MGEHLLCKQGVRGSSPLASTTFQKTMFTVYILYSPSKDNFYVGFSGDISDRLVRHNDGRSKSTAHGVPWELVYSEEFPSRSEAMAREKQIKSWKSAAAIRRLSSEAKSNE
jgi:putative endonuclease